MKRFRDDEMVANIFARAYADTGSIADAFWVTEAVLRQKSTCDPGAVALNPIVEEVAEQHRIRPEAILGTNRERRVSAARYEVWFKLRQRRLSTLAIGEAFDRSHSTVISGLKTFERMLDGDPALRARVESDVERWQRAA